MTDIRYGLARRLFVECLGRRRAADATAVLEARVLGDRTLRSAGTTRIQFANALGETLDKLPAARLLAAAPAGAGLVVCETLRLGPRQPRLLDKNAGRS